MKASGAALEYLIITKGRPIPVKHFRPNQTKKKGVSASPWRRRRQYPSAFIVESLGEHVFWNTHAWSETRERFNKLERIAGPNVPKELVKDQVAASFETLVSTDLPARIEHEVRAITNGVVS